MDSYGPQPLFVFEGATSRRMIDLRQSDPALLREDFVLASNEGVLVKAQISAVLAALFNDPVGTKIIGPAGQTVVVPAVQTARPVIVCLGDSTASSASSMSSNATSVTYNGDGTATINFAVSQGIAKGDVIGVQGSSDSAYEVFESTVINVVGNSYTYTLSPGAIPQLQTDNVAGINIRYPLRMNAAGAMTVIDALTGKNLRFINAGQNGDTVAIMNARFSRDVAPFARGGRVLFTGGINDAFVAGRTLQQLKSEMIILLKNCIEAGAQLDIVTPFPQWNTRVLWTAAKRDVFISFRNFLKQFAADNGLMCWDWASLSVGATQVQDASISNVDGNPGADMAQADKVHPTSAASYILATKIAQFYNSLYGTGPTIGAPRLPTDCGLFSNGLFTGTGGAAVNGTGQVTGQIANNVTVRMMAGTSTANCYLTARTVAADGDVAGFWQGVTLTATAAGDQFQIQLQNLASQLTNGDRLNVSAVARIVAGAGFVKEFSMMCNSQTATTGNLLCAHMMLGTGQMAPYPENFTMKLGMQVPTRSPASTHGAVQNCIPFVQVTAAAAGTFSVEIALASAFKI